MSLTIDENFFNKLAAAGVNFDQSEKLLLIELGKLISPTQVTELSKIFLKPRLDIGGNLAQLARLKDAGLLNSGDFQPKIGDAILFELQNKPVEDVSARIDILISLQQKNIFDFTREGQKYLQMVLEYEFPKTASMLILHELVPSNQLGDAIRTHCCHAQPEIVSALQYLNFHGLLFDSRDGEKNLQALVKALPFTEKGKYIYNFVQILIKLYDGKYLQNDEDQRFFRNQLIRFWSKGQYVRDVSRHWINLYEFATHDNAVMQQIFGAFESHCLQALKALDEQLGAHVLAQSHRNKETGIGRVPMELLAKINFIASELMSIEENNQADILQEITQRKESKTLTTAPISVASNRAAMFSSPLILNPPYRPEDIPTDADAPHLEDPLMNAMLGI